MQECSRNSFKECMTTPKTTRTVKPPKLIVLEKLSKAGETRTACDQCGLSEGCHSPYLQPYKPQDWTGKYLLVGDSTSEFERTGEPFRGVAGGILKGILKSSGVKRADVAFMPVLRCRPSKKPTMKQLRLCASFVYRAIEVLKPKYIVGMGQNAARSLRNNGKGIPIPKLRGREFTNHGEDQKDFKYYITSGIAQAVSSPSEIERQTEDFTRFSRPEETYPSAQCPSIEKSFLGFDTEYTPSQVLCGAISDRTHALSVEAAQLGRVAALLSANVIVGHNLPVDLDALLKAKTSGIKVAMEQWLRGNKQRDTLLLAKLADENRGKGGYTLESLLLAYHNVKDYKHETEAIGPDPTQWSVVQRNDRCRLDAWATLKVFHALEPVVLGPQHITHRISMTLHRINHIGAYVSMNTFQKMKQEVYQEEAEAKAVLLRMAKKLGMRDFVASKDNDVRTLVYEKLGLAIESRTTKGLPSASAKVLKEYKDQYKEIAALLSYSKADKLKTTYCDGLETKLERQADGRFWIRVRINSLGAKTGRRSSASPNFQNWPVRVRKIIVSRFKGGVIADNDYSKLEPIAGGWVTGEHRLTEYFTKYPNGYIKIGQDFFKKTVEKNTKEYTTMKSLVLAILYNKKKWSLAEDLWNNGVQLDSNYEKHIEEAGKILERFLSQLFPGVKRYHRQQEEFVVLHGYVDNIVGQRRRLPLPPMPERSDKFAYKLWMRFKSHVINQAINYPIQSLASYITGCAMVDLEERLLRQFKWSYYDFHAACMAKEWPQMPLLINEVHDDLVMDIPKGMDKKTKEVTHDIMCRPPSLRKLLPDFDVPLSVDTNVGASWGLKS